MQSESAQGPQHWCKQKYTVLANNTVALRGMRFAMDVEVQNAAQKVFQVISTEEFEKTMIRIGRNECRNAQLIAENIEKVTKMFLILTRTYFK